MGARHSVTYFWVLEIEFKASTVDAPFATSGRHDLQLCSCIGQLLADGYNLGQLTSLLFEDTLFRMKFGDLQHAS